MFTLKGNEFSSLINREFVQSFSVEESAGLLPGKFDCRSKNFRDENFDILFLSSHFQDDLIVDQLHDTTHVSLHFQLAGTSDADISGFKPGMKMSAGQFNLINCVDPVSTFFFPKQQSYEYICVGLKPDFFNSVIAECGEMFENLLRDSKSKQSFSLYKTNRITNRFQISALRNIQNPTIADSLKSQYLRSKVKELILLTISDYQSENGQSRIIIPAKDQERIYALREFLAKNYLENHSLESLAKSFLLNEFKLKTGFKAIFGTTVFKYIQLLRMADAHQLLLDGFTTSHVAGLVGYESDAAFIRAFKIQFGYSPGKIRTK